MNYYYDILLNFQDKYSMFYEWDKEDKIEQIKKIPLIYIDNKKYIEILTNIVEFDKGFLLEIKNKTKLKQNNYLLYATIFSDGKNSFACELNEEGITISKSSILLEDELNINEFIYGVEKKDINYKIINKDMINKETRQEIKIKKLLKLEINNMYKNKEYSKLKYIYLEWFNELLDNMEEIYNKMLNKLNNRITEKEYEIYELIKITYNV